MKDGENSVFTEQFVQAIVENSTETAININALAAKGYFVQSSIYITVCSIIVVLSYIFIRWCMRELRNKHGGTNDGEDLILGIIVATAVMIGCGMCIVGALPDFISPDTRLILNIISKF